MFWIAAAVASAATSSPLAHAPVVQARASVRILRATRLSFDEQSSKGTPPLRPAQVRLGGVPTPAKLIEFE